MGVILQPITLCLDLGLEYSKFCRSSSVGGMTIQLALLSLACLASASLNAPKRPHLLLVVADDYGYNDVGYHQNKASGANPNGAQTTKGDFQLHSNLLPLPRQQ